MCTCVCAQAAALPETHVKIRRKHVVEDGFSKLGGYRSELKGVVKVNRYLILFFFYDLI